MSSGVPMRRSGIERKDASSRSGCCVVTAVSLICLIFYKSQYDKLYNVLEVLELFGSKDSNNNNKYNYVNFNANWAGPAFQRLNDRVFYLT